MRPEGTFHHPYLPLCQALLKVSPVEAFDNIYNSSEEYREMFLQNRKEWTVRFLFPNEHKDNGWIAHYRRLLAHARMVITTTTFRFQH
jgi:hypothetical protein